ncbi:MAG: cyclic nucleotide-binding domain-containing protein [Thermodesulfobacteriota bacterium]|jgi:CRP-like cAMP-binding protein|nr:cyclic nucleotide-binding domain-containing protein [Thermodesulfobacteriota bacterium]
MNPIWSNIFRQQPEKDSVAYFLGTIPAFAELKGRDLRYLETMVHVRHYAAGELIFAEGDVGSGMYAIRAGRVRIHRHLPDGGEEELALLEAGDFFGEATLTSPSSRSATAVAIDNCELIGLFRADLMETMQKHPMIASKVLLGLTRILSERLQTAALEIYRLKDVQNTEGPPASASQIKD